MATRTVESIRGEIRDNESRLEQVAAHIAALVAGTEHSPLFGSKDAELAYARTTQNNLLAKRGGLDRDMMRVGARTEPTEEQKRAKEIDRAKRAMDRALAAAAKAEMTIQQLSAPKAA